jgi:hypothetical protein
MPPASRPYFYLSHCLHVDDVTIRACATSNPLFALHRGNPIRFRNTSQIAKPRRCGAKISTTFFDVQRAFQSTGSRYPKPVRKVCDHA